MHKHAGLLRAGIASSGNEHRLGANEAPPAIISVFMGAMLTKVIESIAAGKTSANAAQAMIKLGVAQLPEIEKDNTDRNRTSPFAFTGNKFEFRAVGSSASIAFPIVLLNAAVAEALGEITRQIRANLKKSKTVDDAVLNVVRPIFKETRADPLRGEQLLRGVGEGGREARPAEPPPHARKRSSSSSAEAVAHAAHEARHLQRRRSSSRAITCASSATSRTC